MIMHWFETREKNPEIYISLMFSFVTVALGVEYMKQYKLR